MHSLTDFYKYARKSHFKVLKEHKVQLTPEERDKIMKAGVVWHPAGMPPHAAAWKSVNKGKTTYVSNTHRLYQTAPTIAGIIKKFPAVKASS